MSRMEHSGRGNALRWSGVFSPCVTCSPCMTCFPGAARMASMGLRPRQCPDVERGFSPYVGHTCHTRHTFQAPGSMSRMELRVPRCGLAGRRGSGRRATQAMGIGDGRVAEAGRAGFDVAGEAVGVAAFGIGAHDQVVPAEAAFEVPVVLDFLARRQHLGERLAAVGVFHRHFAVRLALVGQDQLEIAAGAVVAAADAQIGSGRAQVALEVAQEAVGAVHGQRSYSPATGQESAMDLPDSTV